MIASYRLSDLARCIAVTCCLSGFCGLGADESMLVAQDNSASRIIMARPPVNPAVSRPNSLNLRQEPVQDPDSSSLLQRDQQGVLKLPGYDPEGPIMDITIDPRGGQQRPDDQSAAWLQEHLEPHYPPAYSERIASWRAPDIRYQPLYFEDVALERYGQSRGALLQPLDSTGHFFSSVAMFPYNAVLQRPRSCAYPLGFCTPGSCAPLVKQHWLWGRRLP